MLKAAVQQRGGEYERQRRRIKRVNTQIEQVTLEDKHVDDVHRPDHQHIASSKPQPGAALLFTLRHDPWARPRCGGAPRWLHRLRGIEPEGGLLQLRVGKRPLEWFAIAGLASIAVAPAWRGLVAVVVWVIRHRCTSLAGQLPPRGDSMSRRRQGDRIHNCRLHHVCCSLTKQCPLFDVTYNLTPTSTRSLGD